MKFFMYIRAYLIIDILRHKLLWLINRPWWEHYPVGRSTFVLGFRPPCNPTRLCLFAAQFVLGSLELFGQPFLLQFSLQSTVHKAKIEKYRTELCFFEHSSNVACTEWLTC